jgi:hypothetical protein
MKTYALNNNNELVTVSSFPVTAGIPNGRQPAVTIDLPCLQVQSYLNGLNHNLGGAVVINLTDSESVEELFIEGFHGIGTIILKGGNGQTYSRVTLLNNSAAIELQSMLECSIEVHGSECTIYRCSNINDTVVNNSSSVMIRQCELINLTVASGCTVSLSNGVTFDGDIVNRGVIMETATYDGAALKSFGGLVIDGKDAPTDDTYVRSDFTNHADIGDNGAVQVIASDGTGSATYTVIDVRRKEKGGVKVVYGHVQGTLSGLAGGAIPVIRLRADYAHNFNNGAIVDLKGQTESDTIMLGRCYNNTDIRWGEITGGYITGYNGAFNINFMFTTLQ